MLVTNTLFGVDDKIKTALTVLRDLEPFEGYYLAFSGGKDSITIKQLAIESGVKFDAHHNLTTIDPPELVRFIRKFHQDVKIDLPETPFLEMLVRRGFPQRQRRWCCAEYKEQGGAGRLVVTGIRAEESAKRAGRKMVEACYRGGGKRYLNIILNWTEDDVWEFIRSRGLPYPVLYDQGWKRIGCLFCPMAGKHRQVERRLYPRYERNFLKAFEKLYEKGKERESFRHWKSGKEMFDWWINEPGEKEDPDQNILFE